jgi:hypothetical protein
MPSLAGRGAVLAHRELPKATATPHRLSEPAPPFTGGSMLLLFLARITAG